LRYIWQNVIKNKPVENSDVPIQQDVVENYNAPVQQDSVIGEEIAQSAEDSDHRSIFVDETSLDFVYWNSYVPKIKLN